MCERERAHSTYALDRIACRRGTSLMLSMSVKWRDVMGRGAPPSRVQWCDFGMNVCSHHMRGNV